MVPCVSSQLKLDRFLPDKKIGKIDQFLSFPKQAFDAFDRRGTKDLWHFPFEVFMKRHTRGTLL